jgi:uncharacterized protein
LELVIAMRTRLFSVSIVTFTAAFAMQGQANASTPSFDCRKAKQADEIAICANDELALLDNIQATGFKFVKDHSGKKFALIVARRHLKDRRECGEDINCIRSAMQVAILSYRIAGAPVTLPDSRATKAASPTPDSIPSESNNRCAIEDWNYSDKANSIYINGRTTCASGKLLYSLYDAGTGQFIASDFTFIEGFTFRSYTDGAVPDRLRIKYSVEQ